MTTSHDIHGPAGILEALLGMPESPPRAVAVVAHPHPQYGGTLHTKAVYHVGEAIEDLLGDFEATLKGRLKGNM